MAKAEPRIDFASTVFNFGRSKPGDVIKHDYIFTNSGAAMLEITDVKPGCGCTTAGTWDRFVEPGKTGSIPLQFNPGAFNGPVAKSAIVSCNDPSHTNIVLQLSGTIWRPIEVVPASAVFSFSSEGQKNETRVLRIFNHLEAPLTLSDLQCTNSSFRAKLQTVELGKEFELRITAVPPFTTSSVFGSITLKTSSPDAPLIAASAYAMLQPAVMVTPEQISLPPGPLASGTSSVTTIRNNGTNVLQLTEARVDVPGVEIRIQESEPGRLFTLTVNFPAGFQIPADK